MLDPRFPVQEVSTGLPFVIVPLRDLKAVRSCNVNTRELLHFVKDYEAKNILVFSGDTYSNENDLNVRVFTDYLGISEDPATGSANGCLAGYLIKHRYFGPEVITIEKRVEQGYEIMRPSLLLLKAEEKDGEIKIQVGGKVQLVARGELV
jgi:trans-2,3-dihydro-3-hydroxyanthranilate isomerase